MADNDNLTEADVEDMKPGMVYKTLTSYDVDGDALSLPEAKNALRQKIQELIEEAEKTNPEQVAGVSADTAERYRAKRELLLQRCQEIINYLPILDQSDREKLNQSFGREVRKILDEVQEHLSKDDCQILVAGETSAGKSKFLNLLLGENILPVAVLSSTSIICEVKYGKTRKAVVHLREADTVTGSHQITLTLGTHPKEYRAQLDPWIHLKKRDREIIPPATKVEIFWPLNFLKGGVTIVDSPGVGENDMMDDYIAKYISSAFAFIYIIDSSRAGGVQQDRLGRLLLKCKDQGAGSELEQFDPTKAIFVCNKWDQVSEEEREGVKEDTIRKLREMWHGLDESRIFTHSNKKATKGGFRSADFKNLLDGIDELLPQVLNHKLSTQYRRMSDILKEALTFVKLKLNGAHRNIDQLKGKMALSQFSESTADNIKARRDFLQDAVESGVTILQEILHGDELKNHLFNVPIKADFRAEEDALQELMSETEVYLTSRKQFRDHIKATSQKFLKEFQPMVTTVSNDYDKNVRPIWLGFPKMVQKSEEKRSWLCDRAILAMEKDKKLHHIAEQNLRRCFQELENFESDLKAKKKLDERLLEERFTETRNQQDLVSTYQPQVSGITLQLGRLAMIELAEMREYEFDLDDVIGWPDSKNRIAGGSYGEVYQVEVRRDGAPVRAALKVGVMPYAITTEENAWEFLTEEDNLRKLKGDHIVEYYGTACKKEKGGLRMGLVMELCEGTLESRIIGQKEHNLARLKHDLVMKQRTFDYIQDKAIQLCEGLKTIHDAGYIHRDLKLINILVTAGDVVKLSDVGVTKREVDVTGTITGTATYAAPEVKERKVYDKSADIYSLGLILWEMWYGQTVDDQSLKRLKEGEFRMMPQFPDSIHYIQKWESLVRDCVNTDPNRRPSALECLSRLRDMKTEDTFQHSMPVSTI